MNAVYQAEYIWIDGTRPTARLRSKGKAIPVRQKPPIWGFDGSSTEQAPGDKSDCVLKPVFICPDPIRGGGGKLVLCEVLLTDFSPHPTNTRALCAAAAKKHSSFDSWFGIEQEYTFFSGSRPLGFPPQGFPAAQGPYYCSVGAEYTFGRNIVEAHFKACLKAGLSIAGINAEVMPGQWEFQIGPLTSPLVGDQLWVARWLLHRIAEDSGVSVSFDPKPQKGDWNGAGAHTNFSTRQMRQKNGPTSGLTACIAACEALSKKHQLHIENYGDGIENRLTGKHETASYKTFKYGISDRGASIRIPWQVAEDSQGYIEDRRPNANCDPYVVTRLITDTVCSSLSDGK